MRPLRKNALVLVSIVIAICGFIAGEKWGLRPIDGAGSPGVYTGVLGDGADYEFQVPPAWNGILLLYSHGYVAPGSVNPAVDAGDLETGSWLVQHGYAVAGSSYASTGWAVEQAVTDQEQTISRFELLEGRRPASIIAWGHSLGGLVTMELAEKDSGQISGALPLCGVVAGATPIWNTDLAAMAAFKKLLAPSSNLQLTDISDPSANLRQARSIAFASLSTAQGQARLSLVAAIAGIPGWYAPGSQQPQSPKEQVNAQYQWLSVNDLADFRSELEHRAGGNFSSDSTFNFAAAVHSSPNMAEITSLYAKAHLSLTKDLNLLASMRRIKADPAAANYVDTYSGVKGELSVPVFTMHTIGDGLVPVYNEELLASKAAEAGSSSMLRQAFVDRAGHCTFSSAETIAGLKTIIHRVQLGKWSPTSSTSMNLLARSVGEKYEEFFGPSGTTIVKPAFVPFH